MILATYQPMETTIITEKDEKESELEKYLGYKPILCFPANDQKEAIVHSILSTPSYPERIIFFETDEYDTLDIVQWNRYITAKYQREHGNKDIEDIPIEKCFSNRPDRYKEFIVKKISNVIDEIDIYGAFYSNFIFEKENRVVSDLFNGMIDTVKQCGKEEYESLTKTKFEEMPDTKTKKIILKNCFQSSMLPLIYISISNQNFSESIIFGNRKYIDNEISQYIDTFYDKNEPLKYKTYNKYDEMLYRISSCLRENIETIIRRSAIQNKKVPPNAPCPCESGKKFKKCCGRFI